MASVKRKIKQDNDETGDPFWSRILIFTIIVVWVALVAGNWIGHYVIKAGILGKKTTVYGSEFRQSPAVKPKIWKKPVKIIHSNKVPKKETKRSEIIKIKDIKLDSKEKKQELSLVPGPKKVLPKPEKKNEVKPSPTPRIVKPSPSPQVPKKVKEILEIETKPKLEKSKKEPEVVKPSPTPEYKKVETAKKELKPTLKVDKVSKRGNYSLQIGNFEKNDNAIDLVKRLKNKGYSASIVKEGDRFKVYVGSYSDKNKASKNSIKLKSDGFESFVISN